MLKFFTTLIFILGLSQMAISKEVYDANLKIKCFDKIKNTDKDAQVSIWEEISIEIKKIDWNKDASKPPSWGSMTNIKIKADGSLSEASLLLSTKKHLAFSYVADSQKEGVPAFAKIYELDLAAMEMKKTSVALFNQGNNKSITGVSYCEKQQY